MDKRGAPARNEFDGFQFIPEIEMGEGIAVVRKLESQSSG